jgi:3-hydroxyacyl-CoA dehydrogenase/enoyl-CoA hydratase/3-hydroxybutyryl-CoA epimerase
VHWKSSDEASDLKQRTARWKRAVSDQAVVIRTHVHYPAPLKALEVIERGMAAGLEAESKALGELALTETARNLIWLFMVTQRQRKLAAGSTRKADRVAVDRGGGSRRRAVLGQR